jgi:RHS repeat-associated protein
MFHEMVDLRIDGPLPIEFVRRYDSRYANYPGVLGYGWQHNGMMHLQGLGTEFFDFLGHMSQVFVDAQMRRVTFNCRNLPLEVRNPASGTPSPGVCNRDWWPDKIEHLTLTQDDVQHWHITDKHGTIYDFEKANFRAEGKLTAIHDRNDNTISYTYYPDGKLYRITDAFGRYMELTYNANGQLQTLSAGNRTVTYEYQGSDLQKVTYPDGSFVTYTYEAGHRLTQAFDFYGHVIEAHQYQQDPADGQYKVTHTQSDGGNYAYIINRSDPAHPTVTNARDVPVTTTYTVDPLTGVATDRRFGPGCSSCGDAGDRTRKEYDAYLNVTRITDGKGVSTAMTYDDQGNVLTRTEAAGCECAGVECPCPDPPRVTTYAYHETFLDLPVTISVPGTGTGDCATSNPNRVVTFEYDSKGNLLSETITGCNGSEPFEHVTAKTYACNSHGLVCTINGPRDDVNDVADVTTYEYYADNDADVNKRGRLYRVTDALDHVTTYNSYDLFGNVASVTDPNQVETTYVYDGRDRVVEVTIQDPSPSDDDITTIYEYDRAGNLNQIRRPKCAANASCDYSFQYGYDGVNRLEEIADVYGNKIRYTYDKGGNRTREEYQDVAGMKKRFTNFRYDNFNRLEYVYFVEAPAPPANAVHFTYSADGMLDTEHDPMGHETAYEYDALKRLRKVTQTVASIPQSTTYLYDDLDGLTSVTDPNSLMTTYSNGDRGWRLSQVSPDTGPTTYEYDEAGNLCSSRDAKDVLVTREYDALNRLTKTMYPDDTLNVTNSYDSLDVPFGVGRRTGLTDASGSMVYGYDRRGLLTSEEKTIDELTFTTGYDYDKNGNLVELRYPAIDPTTRQGAVDYGYDDADRVNLITVWANGEPIVIADEFEYMPFGPLSAATFGNTLVNSRSFDTRYQPVAWTVAPVLSYTHGFNDDGNLETLADALDPSHMNDRTFGYDEIHRLTSASGPWGLGVACPGNVTYSYDKNGNRMCKGELSPSTSYAYSPGANRLASETTGPVTTNYSYDLNGSTTADGTHTFQYNDAGRLATVDGGTAAYTYDGEGHRTVKVGFETTYYFYDQAGRLLTEMVLGQAAGGATGYGQDYVHLPDAPIGRVDWSVVPNPLPCPPKSQVCPPPRISIAELLYYHNDHLGTPIAMTDESGMLVWKVEYLPFGELFSTTIATVGNNLRFPGQYFDLYAGLHQNWHRDFQPRAGRYLEPDPVGLETETNLYPYASNTPTFWLDPDGRELDSVSASLNQAIARGSAKEIEAILEAGGEVLSQEARLAARAALQRLRSKASDLIARECRGSINRQFPSEMRAKTWEQILDLARKGDQAARKAKKLLLDKRFRK